MHKKVLLFLVLAASSALAQDAKKKSWARVIRDFIRPCLSDHNMANWNRLIRNVEQDHNISTPQGRQTNTQPTETDKSGDIHKVCTFADVAGGIPQEIATLVDMLKNNEKYLKYGINPPKGILLVGPPGCGKTLLARALAGETGCGFLYASATEFIEIFIGTGPQRVRELFDNASNYSRMHGDQKVIIFIDEIDALGSRAALAGHDSESRRTLNELLTQMDGFAQNPRVIVLAATNNPQDVDPALKRAGRFDTIVEIPLPDKDRRRAIVFHYVQKIPSDRVAALDIDRIAVSTYGFNNADLKELVRLAALRAVEQNAEQLQQHHFETAIAMIKAQKRY